MKTTFDRRGKKSMVMTHDKYIKVFFFKTYIKVMINIFPFANKLFIIVELFMVDSEFHPVWEKLMLFIVPPYIS